eukprot:c10860_g1_i2.p1 GENE.c10860_g1_i2~~c10860_g1_i2.p1  ORF type:complete len:1292 (+),score=397.52 c10860_g1_i2:97-3972(+)
MTAVISDTRAAFLMDQLAAHLARKEGDQLAPTQVHSMPRQSTPNRPSIKSSAVVNSPKQHVVDTQTKPEKVLAAVKPCATQVQPLSPSAHENAVTLAEPHHEMPSPEQTQLTTQKPQGELEPIQDFDSQQEQHSSKQVLQQLVLKEFFVDLTAPVEPSSLVAKMPNTPLTISADDDKSNSSTRNEPITSNKKRKVLTRSDSDDSGFTPSQPKKAKPAFVKRPSITIDSDSESAKVKQKSTDQDNKSIAEGSDKSNDDDSDFVTLRTRSKTFVAPGAPAASPLSLSSSTSQSPKQLKKQPNVISLSDELSSSDSSAGVVLVDEDNSSSDNDTDASHSSTDGKKKPAKSRAKPKPKDKGKDKETEPTRHKLRKILADDKLSTATKIAREAEQARMRRLADGESESMDTSSDSLVLNTVARRALLKGELANLSPEQAAARVEEVEPAVVLHAHLCTHAKAHQRKGIQFMWDSLFESVQRTKKDEGLGCVLAHSMGLGKTFQAVSLSWVALTHEFLSIKSIMVLVPTNVLRNWEAEYRKWLRFTKDEGNVRVRVLEDERTSEGRAGVLREWARLGGVLLLGHTMFQNLTSFRFVKSPKLRKTITETLQDPGPDLVFVDEGHRLSNAKTALYKAVTGIRTGRRVAMTGSPLQNNLIEYYTMVNFVRENFMGTRVEFKNLFENPIRNGQHSNSTAMDVSLMKKRAFVLHRLLESVIHRCGYEVLQRDLPPKYEYVLLVRLSPLQRRLYNHYLQSILPQDHADLKTAFQKNVFAAFQNLLKVCNHPQLVTIGDGSGSGSDSDSGFVVGDSESEAQFTDDSDAPRKASKKKPGQHSSKANGNNNNNTNSNSNVKWWEAVMSQVTTLSGLEHSGKICLLLAIIELSIQSDDRVLVFSQSIPTLDMIESVLQKVGHLLVPESCEESRTGNSWRANRDYFRIDGTTHHNERHRQVQVFNAQQLKTHPPRVFLVSTRAGSLGINLVGANRVVIMDVCWNPTHDLQAVFRSYRYGQTKPVSIYRLIAGGTMEERIYDRQVTKQGLAQRVVDETQADRIFSVDELCKLYTLEKDTNPSTPVCRNETARVAWGVEACDMDTDVLVTMSQDSVTADHDVATGTAAFAVPDYAPPADKVMATLVLQEKGNWISRFHEHDSLLQHVEREELSKQDQELVWREHIQRIENPNPTMPPRLLPQLPSVAPRYPSLYSSVSSSSSSLAHLPSLLPRPPLLAPLQLFRDALIAAIQRNELSKDPMRVQVWRYHMILHGLDEGTATQLTTYGVPMGRPPTLLPPAQNAHLDLVVW